MQVDDEAIFCLRTAGPISMELLPNLSLKVHRILAMDRRPKSAGVQRAISWPNRQLGLFLHYSCFGVDLFVPDGLL